MRLGSAIDGPVPPNVTSQPDVAASATPSAPATTPPARDAIVFVGLTDAGASEAGALQAFAKRSGDVVAAVHPAAPAPAVAADRVAITRAVARDVLGLPDGTRPTPEQARRANAIARVIIEADPNARDELMFIARQWAPALRGEESPGRLVLSGHHTDGGSSILDDLGNRNTVSLPFNHIAKLCDAMPEAAARLEDVHLGLCHGMRDIISDGERGNAVDLLRRHCPNLRTVWGYDGIAPSVGTNSAADMQSWMKLTAGDGDLTRADLMRAIADRPNLAVWSRTNDVLMRNPAHFEDSSHPAHFKVDDGVGRLFGTLNVFASPTSNAAELDEGIRGSNLDIWLADPAANAENIRRSRQMLWDITNHPRYASLPAPLRERLASVQQRLDQSRR